MSVWSEFRSTVGLPVGRTPWGVLCTVLILLTAGWLLQERVTAPSMNDLDYSELCRFIDEGRVELVVIKGQAVEGDFFEPQKIAGHQTRLFRATAPTNDPSFWPLLHEKKVRVQVIAVGPGLLTRLALGSVPLTLFLGFGLWVSRRGKSASAA
ncbi:MAG TPA: hypothetical protein VF294_01285 [Polyangiaceae bacterium]